MLTSKGISYSVEVSYRGQQFLESPGVTGSKLRRQNKGSSNRAKYRESKDPRPRDIPTAAPSTWDALALKEQNISEDWLPANDPALSTIVLSEGQKCPAGGHTCAHFWEKHRGNRSFGSKPPAGNRKSMVLVI